MHLIHCRGASDIVLAANHKAVHRMNSETSPPTRLQMMIQSNYLKGKSSLIKMVYRLLIQKCSDNFLLLDFHSSLLGANCFAEDTCSAFEEFQRSPGDNSLNSLIPYADKAQANRIMIEIGHAVHVFISKLNLKIVQTITTLRLYHDDEALRSEKWKICDPFSHDSNYTYYPDS
ncbi:hypothetical protein Sjap_017224 [Stephania japonica]|uniref:Uncharacterized protein n=1 Tax=Stephania japonica TaxID=461633 RepID=A0AAP0NJM9_9MAGN